MKKINVIGLGYIGLPTALMFAAHGIEVVGTDIKKDVVNDLNNGKLNFEEEGLEELFNKAKENGIEFSNEYLSTNKYIITVPTPYLVESKKIDAKYVVSAVEKVLDVCEIGSIIAIESTISPGTIDKYIRPIISKKGYKIGQDVHIVHAPERIIPGRMVYELQNNARTIGADNEEVGMIVRDWYEVFCKGEIVVTDIKTAEMSKVVENTFRDINIAYANELAKICRKENMDVYKLIEIANKHPRVNILQPGPGVGGHCISVDPWFLVGDYPEEAKLIRNAREVNDSMPKYVLDRIRKKMTENKINDFSKVGIYGLTYKEDVDDIRESPTLQLLDCLEEDEMNKIKLFDPCIKKQKVSNQVMNFYTFINDIELIVIMVAHSHIKDNFELISDKVIFDTRNIIESSIYKL